MGAALEQKDARSLLMVRSPGFGSGVANYGVLPAPTQVKLASHVNLLAHYAKGTLSLMLQLLQLTPSFLPLKYELTSHRRRTFPSRYCALSIGDL